SITRGGMRSSLRPRSHGRTMRDVKAPRIATTDFALTRIEQVRANRKQPDAGVRIAITGRQDGSFSYDLSLVPSGAERAGCGMAEVTLGQGVRVAIIDRFPQITEVRDTTDHAQGANPYYQAAKK